MHLISYYVSNPVIKLYVFSNYDESNNLLKRPVYGTDGNSVLDCIRGVFDVYLLVKQFAPKH